ncbi:hypothetical protein C8Q77DRAFT_433470 [Trametes polyzona]|nr:hypothetical protein C8Q77DRAFT_433470 [Trametes polyzona]
MGAHSVVIGEFLAYLGLRCLPSLVRYGHSRRLPPRAVVASPPWVASCQASYNVQFVIHGRATSIPLAASAEPFATCIHGGAGTKLASRSPSSSKFAHNTIRVSQLRRSEMQVHRTPPPPIGGRRQRPLRRACQCGVPVTMSRAGVIESDTHSHASGGTPQETRHFGRSSDGLPACWGARSDQYDMRRRSCAECPSGPSRLPDHGPVNPTARRKKTPARACHFGIHACALFAGRERTPTHGLVSVHMLSRCRLTRARSVTWWCHQSQRSTQKLTRKFYIRPPRALYVLAAFSRDRRGRKRRKKHVLRSLGGSATDTGCR